jgi:uncharacterized protein (DUF305 family)
MKALLRSHFFVIPTSVTVLLLLSLFIVQPLSAYANGVPMSDALSQAMISMNTAMNTAMSNVPVVGNPDVDFAAMMIPHHQGAIDMAKVELRSGTDPRLRRLAQEIIVTQQIEIALMRLTLEHPLTVQMTVQTTPSP